MFSFGYTAAMEKQPIAEILPDNSTFPPTKKSDLRPFPAAILESTVVPIKRTYPSRRPLPAYATSGSAGMDLIADPEDGISVILQPGKTRLIPTGISVAVPPGYELQIRSRSGLALKFGVHVLNAPGTIDSDYRGAVGVILHNASTVNYIVHPGDRIAQAVLNEVPTITWQEVSELPPTDRTGGFGSTGR